LAGPQDVEIALPTSGLAVTSRMLQENPQLIKRTLRAMLKAQRFVFENKRETLQIMVRWLELSPEVAERSYELAGISLSRDGEIVHSMKLETSGCSVRRKRNSRSLPNCSDWTCAHFSPTAHNDLGITVRLRARPAKLLV
jgi:hypothetical protein